MCDKCEVQHGVAALEALANGEDIPEAPESDVEVQKVPVCLPFPVMITVSDTGFAGIITNDLGASVIQGFLKSIGHHPDDCPRHHH
ncbi:hypothetical protein HCJ93_08475 [Streptomyces sp. SBST2-5]|jgi:hypothetical protein|uniref:Uncharacterized protein n=1 Tax=Streptomyces composti TaxID=2720025 RepID=A0ABX1A3W9_9ACTN|nr:hypothetical protein [Streptomyces composti]NJP50106.1 hypothetical protein [Streptomyces composti]